MLLVRITRSSVRDEALKQRVQLALAIAADSNLSGPDFRRLLHQLARKPLEAAIIGHFAFNSKTVWS
jgi:hypothetical protein